MFQHGALKQTDHRGPDQYRQQRPQKAVMLPKQGGERQPAGGGEDAETEDAEQGQAVQWPLPSSAMRDTAASIRKLPASNAATRAPIPSA